tara:strand:- start:1105 stop:1269 length:165 start_codon:yes stop_codon:yes gene_type:complete
MNAGTSIGVAVAVPVVLFLSGAWRSAYVSFASLGSVVIPAPASSIAINEIMLDI